MAKLSLFVYSINFFPPTPIQSHDLFYTRAFSDELSTALARYDCSHTSRSMLHFAMILYASQQEIYLQSPQQIIYLLYPALPIHSLTRYRA